MADKSKIEWTDATWNPWTGCHKVSQGCARCYMFRDKTRYGQDPNVVKRAADKTFYAPLKWAEPKKVFTCSWSDFFIEESDPWRFEAWAMMARTPWHTYQVLTKRPDRMLNWVRQWADLKGESPEPQLVRGPEETRRRHPSGRAKLFADHLESLGEPPAGAAFPTFDWAEGARWLPSVLPNVWLGVSVEDQKTADERIPLLLETPAAVRFLSVEPLLGLLDIQDYLYTGYLHDDGTYHEYNQVDWVIVGGESGPDARPMHPNWVRIIRDQCQAAGVPFFFKQWGEWWPYNNDGRPPLTKFTDFEDQRMYWLGKTKAGRILDGREWSEFPDGNAR